MNKMFTGLGRGMFVLVMVAALCAPRVSDASCSTIRAVSMRVLQEELRACQGAGECAEELQKLAYLSRILGYLVDRATGDVIILGQVDPNLPSLYVEDFVVALRSTWGKYRSSPAPICSIDPDPNVVRRLERIGRNILSSRTPEQAEGHISDWHRTCRSPQTVRVLGVPFHTRFAHVMVEADYAMKSIVDGTDSLAVEGLSSLVDMTLDQARRDLERGGPVSVSLSMNRFWFYAGENQYDEAEDIFLISKSPVELSTRETNISNSRIIDTGRVNPLARDFAEAFTSHYQEAAVQRPFFAELENLYRFVALTKIMQYKKVQIESGLKLSYLLEDYPIAHTEVRAEIPGRSNVERFFKRWNVPGGYQEAHFLLPTCGGVNMGIRIGPHSFDNNTRKGLALLKSSLLAARPTSEALYWDYTSPNEVLLAEDFDEDRLLQQMNEVSEQIHVISVEHTRSGLIAKDGTAVIYQGADDKSAFLEAIVGHLGSNQGKTLFFVMKNLPTTEKAPVFGQVLNMQQEANRTHFSIRVVSDIQQMVDYFMTEVRLVETGVPQKENSRWITWLTFTLKNGAQVILRIITKTADLASAIVQYIKEAFSSAHQTPLAKGVSEAVWRANEELGFSEDELIIEYENQCKGVNLVEAEITRKRKAA